MYFSIVLIILITRTFAIRAANEAWCYTEPFPERPNMLPEFTKPRIQKTIYFFETTCFSTTVKKVILSPRQTCSIESAALANPKADIYVLFTGMSVLNINENTINALIRYPNVHFKWVNVTNYFAKTPAEKTYMKLRESLFVFDQMNNLLRLVTLWKFGGITLDMDTVTRTNLYNYGTNFIGMSQSGVVYTAVMSFDLHGFGHRFLEGCLKSGVGNYEILDRGSFGEVLLNRKTKARCRLNYLASMMPHPCKGITIYADHVFYPIGADNWSDLFDEGKLVEVLKKISPSAVVYTWSDKSDGKERVPSNQPFSLLAKRFCPNTYTGVNWYSEKR